MTPQEKTALVVQTIFDGLEGKQSGRLNLTIADNDSLNGKIIKPELDDILKHLQYKEHVIEVLSEQLNKRITGEIEIDQKTGKKTFVPLMNVPPVMPTKKAYDFAIHILPKFTNWHSAYQVRINRKIEDLSEGNLQKVIELTKLINDQFQMQGVPEYEFYVRINYEDCLKFLYDKSVLQEYNARAGGGWGTFKIQLTLNVKKFVDFYSQIQEIQKQKFTSKAILKSLEIDSTEPPITPPPNTAIKEKAEPDTKNLDAKPLYWITFPISNEILLNDLVVLAKPNLNGENGNIFAYLMAHPNKTISKKEIEEHIGETIGKDFHKVVENLGFKADVKKAFFRIGTDSILFRNPITKSDFSQLNIPALRISPKYK